MDARTKYQAMMNSFAERKAALDAAFLSAKAEAETDEARIEVQAQYNRAYGAFRISRDEEKAKFFDSLPKTLTGSFNALIAKIKFSGEFQIIRYEDKLKALELAEQMEADGQKEIEPCPIEN